MKLLTLFATLVAPNVDVETLLRLAGQEFASHMKFEAQWTPCRETGGC
jgi:hypothetical protein